MPKIDSIPCELLSWARFHDLCRRLAARILDSDFTPDVIVAIARGGYAPARLLCDYLRVMELTSVRVVHYRRMAQAQTGARVADPLAVDLTARNVLVVDDVSDTGDTFEVAIAHVSACGRPGTIRTAVLLHKSTSRISPDFWGARMWTWRWVIFPWARIEDLSSLVAALPGAPRAPEAIARALREQHGLRVARRTLDDVLRHGERWTGATP